jgi:hypothetical protein
VVGDMPRLNAALGQGLDAGLTISEVKEILFHTSRAAIDAARADKPLPDGTVITLVDIRSGQIPLCLTQ